jgi:hypothetical protein
MSPLCFIVSLKINSGFTIRIDDGEPFTENVLFWCSG